MIGTQYEHLTVVAIDPKSPRGGVLICRCECGREKAIKRAVFLTGCYKSCGCMKGRKQRIDISGEKFGRLTAIAISNERSRPKRVVWECRCECGEIAYIRRTQLTTGTTKSCGCLQRENRIKHGLSHTLEMRRYWRRTRERAVKLRTPKWADMEAIRNIYLNAPEGYEVDHIIPLQGKLVSGLHVAENLQYLTQADNWAKKAKFEPQFISR